MQEELFNRVQEKFREYRNHKRAFDDRVIENNRWYKGQHWGFIQSRTAGEGPEPVSAFLFNALATKHADAMDNYPEPVILEREQGDAQAAGALTKILPLVLDMGDFKQTYSRCWWYKLKNGACCYGVFFNPALNHGLGDIDIKKIDLLNLYWEPSVTDIQDSSFLFYAYLAEDRLLKRMYPEYADLISGNQNEIKSYDDGLNTSQGDKYADKAMVVDCYYKEGGGVNLVKFCGGVVLEEAEGIYDHGMYPFVLDVMYPDEDSPVGFGLIELLKSPQMYIDRLDMAISKNAVLSATQRWMIKDNGGVNEQELLDATKDVIHVAGSLEDSNVRQFQANPISPYIVEHRKNKIAELKEIAGNRDFQQGGTTSGVTAYGAITALQQAGEKLSRDMIGESYEAYKNIMYMCVELVRQFYDEERRFRITGENGQAEYIAFSNEGIKEQPVPSELPEFWGGEARYRRPEFDIRVMPQRANPFTKESHNQTLLQLWSAGAFSPDMAHSAIAMLGVMQFDGKDELIRRLEELDQTAQMMGQMQQENMMLREQVTGNREQVTSNR